MTGEERLEILTELLRTTQVARKNIMGNLDDAFEKATGEQSSDEELEEFLAKSMPWLFGPKSIVHLLIKVTTKKSLPTGMDMYNILIMAHRLDESGVILKAYEVYTNDRGSKLPKPDIKMCGEF
ncbi:MAG: hypothetical protein GWN93_06035 [Deltaproteobacteria bacterium]|nr:hypothetical protein [Deltaproteobacteria bacterium]